MSMKISAEGLAIVKAFEGRHRAVKGQPGHFRAYVDPVGVLTICDGHTNHHPPKFTVSTVWDDEKCDEVLARDLGTFEKRVDKLATVPMKQHQFDALVSWAFNTGGPMSANVWKKLNAKRYDEVPSELLKWNKGGGRVLSGLVRRRKAEAALFEGDLDEAFRIAGVKRPQTKPAARRAEPRPEPQPVPRTVPVVPSRTPSPMKPDPAHEPQKKGEIEQVQEWLKELGYHEVGEIDDTFGSRTTAAIAAFKRDWALPGLPVIDEHLKVQLEKAVNEHWKRPISPERKDTTPSELAPSMPDIAASQKNERVSFWGAIATAVTGIVTGIVNLIGDAIEMLKPVKEFVSEVPWGYWAVGVFMLAGALYYISTLAGTAKQEATKAYQEGERF